MEPIERARAYFSKDHFATEVVGIKIDAVEKGYARCSLQITSSHLNAAGSVMGGVLFTVADFTFAVAANFDQPLTVTISSNISFLEPPHGKTLLSEASCIRQGGHTCYYQVCIMDETATIVAVIGITGFIKKDSPT